MEFNISITGPSCVPRWTWAPHAQNAPSSASPPSYSAPGCAFRCGRCHQTTCRHLCVAFTTRDAIVGLLPDPRPVRRLHRLHCHPLVRARSTWVAPRSPSLRAEGRELDSPSLGHPAEDLCRQKDASYQNTCLLLDIKGHMKNLSYEISQDLSSRLDFHKVSSVGLQ